MILKKLARQNLTIRRAVSDCSIIIGTDIHYFLLDDMMVEVNVLPDVPFYLKVACHKKDSPCSFKFRYKKHSDLTVYTSRVVKYPTEANFQQK